MKKNQLTLASAFEKVTDRLKESALTEAAFQSVQRETSFLYEKLKITPVQAFILAVMLHRPGKSMDTEYLAEYANVSPVRIMEMQKDLDVLMKKNFIQCVKKVGLNLWKQIYSLSPEFIQIVSYNRRNLKLTYKNLTPQDVLDMFAALLQDCDYDRMDYRPMVSQITLLIDATQHIGFCRKLKELNLGHAELVLLLVAATHLVNKDMDTITTCEYEDILPAVFQRKLVCSFLTQSGMLCEKGMMVAKNKDCDSYGLTEKAKHELLDEFYIPYDLSVPVPKEEAPSVENEIRKKKMIYNQQEKVQIERLTRLLEPARFTEVQDRMKAIGMRTGFPCLFYGSPGTGKTETVLQLARETGREIVQVNLSVIKDKYVGESEKNIQKIFDDYQYKMKSSEVTPILLFNEADGIFGKRHSGVSDSVDQMENTIQNIILQNLDNFEGILIATTNLTDNFDKAFERRFIYKIEFRRPNKEVRKQIWLSMLPELKGEDAEELAACYELSGGQIENVVRKQMVESVLYDLPISLGGLKNLCVEEKGFSGNQFRLNKMCV